MTTEINGSRMSGQTGGGHFPGDESLPISHSIKIHHSHTEKGQISSPTKSGAGAMECKCWDNVWYGNTLIGQI